LGISYPSQTRPTCSWTSQPPSNADALCNAVFHTLRSLADAEERGDDATVRRLVTNPAVAHRIIAYGRTLRAAGVQNLHIVPSFTLGRVPGGYLGAGFFILGKTRHGTSEGKENVYLHFRGETAIVVRDQPAQEW
jgi:hypothetical protein